MQPLQFIFSAAPVESIICGFLFSLFVSILLVYTKDLHGVFTMDLSSGIQKFHITPTPRIGGIPILIGLVVAWFKATPEIKFILTPILAAGIPAFTFGLAEDLTKKVGVVTRLLATMFSGLLAWWITDYSIGRVDVWGLDYLLKFTFFSVLFTSFSVGGIANAINIIDGFNGLASTMAILGNLGFAVIAWTVGDLSLACSALILAACIFGFFMVNWPFGKLFLGDGGAYFIGFALAWMAVLLIERNPTVSPFAALLICIHPVSEVLLSIFRRIVKNKNTGNPDRLHFHSIINQRYTRRWFKNTRKEYQNSITGILMGSMTFTAILIAPFIYSKPLFAMTATIFLFALYIIFYFRMINFKWKLSVNILSIRN